ncbi:MAG: hypothetical protein HKM07_02340 [Chlamydiae bacterium]|nr:hypothetical protein [Chlamydiota bacterium]
MHRKVIGITICILLMGSTAWANDKDIAIHTWGGGEFLSMIFNAIAMLIYGNSDSGIDKTFQAILRIALGIGSLSAICSAFFRDKFDSIINNFALPATFIMCCLLLPRTTIYIKDHLAEKSKDQKDIVLFTVKNTPFFLGKFASLVSTINYNLTNALENVTHGTNDKLYNWTGHIYAGENIFRTKKCRIANPLIEDNLREFCRECVFRDLGIGIYSKQDLINSKNVLQFLEENTSQIRTVFYKDIQDGTAVKGGSFLTCQEAIKKIHSLLGKTEGNTKEIILGETTSDLSLLLKDQKNADIHQLTKQQIAIQLLKEEIPGTLHSFAAKRADLLQKENQKILGALGASSLVAMKNCFEGLIYMVFPIVVIFALLSFGVQALIQWLHFLLWINIWSPFYVVVKFLLNVTWKIKTSTFGDNFGLTVYTSEGLGDLYSFMESIACVCMFFIPFLSWVVIKGGVGQMVQLASSLMAPGQSAAATASAEKAYGNYSYGNVNYDNTNAYSASMLQQRYSGSLSYGSVGIDGGSETITYAPSQDELFVKQGDSHLRESIAKSNVFQSSVQDSYSKSTSAVKETSHNFSDSLADTSSKAVGFVNALSQHYQSGQNYNVQEQTSLQRAAQHIQGVGEDYAKTHGLQKDEAMREVIQGGLSASLGKGWGIFGGKLSGDYNLSSQTGLSSSESNTRGEKAFESDTFQESLQTIANASKGDTASIMSGEDQKLHQDFSESYNKTVSYAEQHRAALQQQEASAELKSYSESDNLSYQQNLNQRFVSFLQDKYQGDSGKIIQAIEMPGESEEKKVLVKEFISDFLPQNHLKDQGGAVNNSFESYSENLKKYDESSFDTRAYNLKEQSYLGVNQGDAQNGLEQVRQKVEAHDKMYLSKVQGEKGNIQFQSSQKKDSINHELKKEDHLFSNFIKENSNIAKPFKKAGDMYNQLFGEKPNSPKE